MTDPKNTKCCNITLKNSESILVFLDESGHLKNNEGYMVLGCIWGQQNAINELSNKIKALKTDYNIPLRREIKWTKVSDSKKDYYLSLLGVFCDTDGVNYRGVIVDKNKIDNQLFHQTDDDFYYKLVYLTIRNIAERSVDSFKVFLDYKDTHSTRRSEEQMEYLQNTTKLAGRKFSVQPIRSYESSSLQMADLINGAISYSLKENKTSEAKRVLVGYLTEKMSYTPYQDTPRWQEKFNLLFWESSYTK